MNEVKRVPLEQIHYVWNNAIPPALTVHSGEPFEVSPRDASGLQLRPGTSLSRLRSLDLSGFWPMSGPVAVHDARPGDAVDVEIISLRTGSHGWTALIPERGLLRKEFSKPYLHSWELPDDPAVTTALLRPGIRVPLQPALGVVGCAPKGEGTSSPVPPRHTGGKLDPPWLGVGARILLPVQVPGALVSFGQPRAAQGAGEVCGWGIECEGTLVARATIHRGAAPANPVVILPPRPPAARPEQRVTLASAPNPADAARAATHDMIAWLRAEHGMSRELAYILCSVAADLAIVQAVNTPHWTVSLSLPLSVFTR